ncbi:hypothetical protein [Phycicoccus sonneratiae]|uniref:Uncharacterized protein n=1 Tax=Phycicoccus sonneratiae TaxID=2807628 RepID=A0ABS2CKY1_9MICO|nr:hypothetical protein [Phycicoccus sonneraticus]MBM6400536.1 hypothetical protein [Phycicoccus sonneraticus]
MSTFLRRNRRALVALPFLLALAVAASSQRMVTLWWPNGMNDRIAVDDTGTARFEGDVELQSSVQHQRIAVRFVEAAPVDRMRMSLDEEVPVPPGFRAVRVRIHVETAPTAVITTCQVLLRDENGATWAAGTTMFDGGLADLASCQPLGVQNPSGFDIDREQDRDADPEDRLPPRPAAFERDAVFVLPEAARPTTVRVSPDLRQFAEWPLPAGAAAAGTTGP